MGAFLCGKLSGESVCDALKRVLEFPPKRSVFIVRSIDSIRSPEGVSKALSFHGVHHDIVHGNVCLSRDDLMRALAADVFTGFDEVWVFSEAAPAENLGAIPSATSETTDFGEAIPEELREAIDRTGCFLVLGDGCGLNYATADVQIAKTLTGDVA